MKTTDPFEYYERLFAKAIIELPEWKPWQDDDKQQIRRITKNCLGIKDEWIPQIKAETVKEKNAEKFKIEFVKFNSWENVTGTAHLYVPDTTDSPKPFVILCCGHGKDGKLYSCYQAMARRLARQGAIALIPDNIGQGERIPMGHKEPLLPFACGTSLQGLIVMETLGWIDWAMKNDMVDNHKMAAIGNSGGGTLTVFLSALSADLSVLCSSGYPSSFNFVARKEKCHCSCNILPNIVGQLEMWHLLGTFAPRPLFIFQGRNDNLFPEDLFFTVSRKTKAIYSEFKAEDNFEFELFPGEHSWDSGRRFAMSDFLSRRLDIAPAEEIKDDLKGCLDDSEICLKEWPDNALTTDELAKQLTGKNPPSDITLPDIFPPNVSSEALKRHTAIRVEDARLLAQFAAFLKK